MKEFLILIVVVFFSVSAFAQLDNFDSPKMLAKNERKYEKDERKLDRIFFKNFYRSKTYSKYSGSISSDTIHHSTYIQFDSIRVYLFEHTDKYKSIFISGLVSGQMIYCALDSSCRAIEELETYSNGKPYIHSLWGWTGHTIKIDYFELLNDVKSKSMQRRFKFWVDGVGGGATVLILELTNEKADNKTDIESFIEGAKVTFLRQAWIEQ